MTVSASTDTILLIGTLAVSGAIFLVAAVTLWFTVPRRARLVVDRFSELDRDDLLFVVYPSPNPDDVPLVPRDYLLQLEVAVANVGGRKAILSSVRVIDFLTQAGERVFLPESVQGPIFGMQWEYKTGWAGQPGNRIFENVASVGPYVLAADDAIVIRFRTHRGIDWSARWTLPSLKKFHEGLSSPFKSARVEIVWRRGREIVRNEFDIALTVKQQEVYLKAIEDRTQGFTVRPAVDEMAFQIE